VDSGAGARAGAGVERVGAAPRFNGRGRRRAASGLSSELVPDVLEKVGIDQKLDRARAVDAVFRAEDGREVRLGEYFGSGPSCWRSSTTSATHCFSSGRRVRATRVSLLWRAVHRVLKLFTTSARLGYRTCGTLSF